MSAKYSILTNAVCESRYNGPDWGVKQASLKGEERDSGPVSAHNSCPLLVSLLI